MLPLYMSKPFDVQYFQHIKRLFGTALIGYWPLDEAAGASTVTDYSGQANNGTPSNVTFGQAGIGDGRTSALFVPASSSYVDLFSAGLAADVSVTELTLAIWAKVSAAGVWADSTFRTIMLLRADGNNEVEIYKPSANNSLGVEYIGGGTSDVSTTTSYANTYWQHIALTLSKSADELKGYVNGVQAMATQSTLDTWSGALTAAILGAYTLVPASVWSGYLAHAILLNRAATAQEIAEAARVSV